MNAAAAPDRAFASGDYDSAIAGYEAYLDGCDPVDLLEDGRRRRACWYLGLCHLLRGNPDAAQAAWLAPAIAADDRGIAALTGELVAVLRQEAARLEAQSQVEAAGRIRLVVWELAPTQLHDLVAAAHAALALGCQAQAQVLLAAIAERLEVSASPEAIGQALLARATAELSTAPPAAILAYGELCARLLPESFAAHAFLADLYLEANRSGDCAFHARRMAALAADDLQRTASHYLIARGLLQSGGYWEETKAAFQDYERSLEALMASDRPIPADHALSLSVTGALALYLDDRPDRTHALLRRLGTYCQAHLQAQFPAPFADLPPPSRSPAKLRVGYISECLRRHSVGWLSRWVFAHHDRDRCEIVAYSLVQTDDDVQRFIARHCDRFYAMPSEASIVAIARQIHADGLDMLVDLDCLTSPRIQGVLALKPAPLQVSWLGSDASGLPAVDYFLCDRQVVPGDAEGYYTPKLWRLPDSYIAVDGFETGIPTLRRADWGIPTDAIAYLTCQSPAKRHPDTARLQLEILRAVPDSVLLVKGGGDAVAREFHRLAIAMGLDAERLYFLPETPTEEEHRANFAIADVVLDTYPYNGATTTLEALWMGLPLVTRVGQQFAARNSYTMLAHAGIAAGIAWNEADYIAWGVRFGTDRALRQHVAAQLGRSRQSAPLWDGRRFVRALEAAYEAMCGRQCRGT